MKVRETLLIEGDTQAEVVRKMNELVNDAGWEIWNVAEKYASGGYYAIVTRPDKSKEAYDASRFCGPPSFCDCARYIKERGEDITRPRSSARIEHGDSTSQVAGSNPAGGAI